MRLFLRLLAGAVLSLALALQMPAQSIYGTITGIVSDPSNAVISGAKLKLRDMQSGSMRETITNSEGYYTFASVPPGAYELTATNSGFESYTQQGIGLRGGDKLNFNLTLKVGNTANTVVVTGDADLVAPVDSGEKADRLTIKELESFIQVGSNAAEFIKIMPGFAISNGTSNTANYDGTTIGINGNGNSGNQSPLNNAYSYNGLPANTLDITADGAHVSDPGCNCATPVNPNSNMISEFKITISNFSAEHQKGPGVISSVARGGGQRYSGSVYLTARHASLNANDWLSNYTRVPRPQNKYFYPGFNLGGPVKLPFTRFNKNRDKLFFFTGLQYFYQTLDTGLLRATVPTEGMRNGNFSPDEVAKLGRITSAGAAPQQLNVARGLARFPNGIIPVDQIDKNTQSLMKLYPAPNADPNSNGGFNWVDQLQFQQNGYQSMSRVDYSISDNTKLFVRYNLQREVQLFPIGLWSSAKNQPPYPSPIQGKNRSDSITASLAQVFSPSMTNEVVFGYTFIGFPNVFRDPDKVDRNKIGYAYKGLFKNGVAQFPNITGAGTSQEVANISTNGGFEVGGPGQGLYANKYMPSVSDNLTKIMGTHTLKAGMFYEYIRNAQPASNTTQGQLNVNNNNPNSLGSAYADMLTGILNSYAETSFNRINDIYYHTAEAYVQDSWKVTRRLSVEAGLRFSHFTPWTDNIGFGFSVFDYSKYNPSCRPTDYCGFVWNARDPKVPLGGYPTRFGFWQPRAGMAYMLGKNTVLRGGWGRYVYHSGQFTTGLNVSGGMQVVNLSNNQGAGNTALLASQLDTLAFNTAALSTGAVDAANNRQPVTDSYSFTISQRVPWSGLVEVAYVGNQTRNIATNSGFGSDINMVPLGAMLSSRNNGVDPNTLVANNFRPYKEFNGLPLATNINYSNYNSLQTKYMRTRGRAVITMNYTFGKAMGIVSSTLDSFNQSNNYAVQPTNRSHIFNAAYSYTLPKLSRQKLAGTLINSWQFSGITQIQSGPNLTGQRGQTFGMALNAFKIPGTTHNVSATSLHGTPNIALTPILTCDPRKNLGPNQFINSSCFSFPRNVGENGPTTLPAIYGPAYFNSDLGIFKNFSITERKKLQFRANGYNFLNHPLWSFNNQNLNLGFNGTTGALNTPLFGTVTTKQGRRLVQFAATFTF
ncbi:MAG: carboxypeptidase regulatory-like domain-containing protein [Acidobacteria bacterium]|nr:carboxypeptidase regulatory-like domain-containing protein [Acidobacteriota bacterium]